MRIRVKGEMTLAEVRQALWEALQRLESEYAVEYSRGATLYINPTNELGEDVVTIAVGVLIDFCFDQLVREQVRARRFDHAVGDAFFADPHHGTELVPELTQEFLLWIRQHPGAGIR